MQRYVLPFVILTILGAALVGSLVSCKHQAWHPVAVNDTTTTGSGKDTTGNTGGRDTTTHQPAHPCSPDSVYFTNDILPLITSNCTMSGCHDGSGKSDDARSLTSYAAILGSGYVRAGNPASSRLYTSLKGSGEEKMPRPPVSPLTAAQDSLIMKWIAQGALNNSCDGNCDTTNITYSGTIAPLIQNACYGCHSGSAPSGNVLLTSYANVLTQVQNGMLKGDVTNTGGFHVMPPTGQLSPCDVSAFTIWIAKGAPNN